MDGVMRLGRGFVLLPLVALIGCGPPDYTPVRDWAGVAGNAALYPELVTRPGSTPAPVPAADAINAMQQSLSTYLQALGTLSADGLLMIREDPLAAYAPRVAATSPKGAEAIQTLGALLRERGRSLARALADWFPGHADYMDAALSHWMAKRSYGGKPLVFRRDAVKA